MGLSIDDFCERLYVHLNPSFTQLVRSNSVLFLQGPIGPMFTKLFFWLEKKGTQVHRVAFNGGDEWDCRSVPQKLLTYFDLPMSSWPPFFRDLCIGKSIDTVILFGQSRPCHQSIIKIAKKMGSTLPIFL